MAAYLANAMLKTHQKKTSRKPHPLVGTWISADQHSTVEYMIKLKGNRFAVCAIDSFDGEQADIFEIKRDGQALSFAAYWNSTGRFSRCRLMALSDEQVNFTYTHTDQEILHRKQV
jgi:hypothetical protein